MRAQSWIRVVAATSGALGVALITASVDASPRRSTNASPRRASVDASPRRSANQTLDVSVSGSGHVTSSPAGIDCPGTCSASYKDFSGVSLSAKADSGWTFFGWSGDCKGSGACNVTMDTKHAVGATFTQNPPPPPPTTTAVTTTPPPPPPPPAKPGPPTFESFDAFPNGTPIDKIVGIHFTGGVRVVTPTNVAPSSFPRVLSASGSPGQSCGDASRIQMAFTAPLMAFSLRSGIDDTVAPADGTWARLLGYDSAGHLVATSDDVLVATPGHLGSIQTPLSLTSAAGDIASATLSVGCDTASHNTGPRRAMGDGFVLTPNLTYLIPPSITIDSPADGAVVTGGTPTVSGHLDAPEGGVQDFCVVDFASLAMPEPCNQQVAYGGHSPLGADGNFSISLGLSHGRSNVYAWVRDHRNQAAIASIIVTHPDASQLYTLSTLGMEITQGVQEYQLPVLDRTSPPVAGIDRSFPIGEYVGVRLAQAKKTIVRVFAQATPITVPGVGAQLWGYRNDGGTLTPLPGSPVGADYGARTLGPTTIRAQRTTADGGFVFTLPPTWTSDTITLVARLVPPHPGAFFEVSTDGDVAGVENILFEHQNDYTMTAVGETNHDPSRVPPSPVQPVFSDLVTMLPTGDGQVHVYGYAAMIDVQGGWNLFDIINHDIHLVDALCGYWPGAHDGQLVGVFGVGITNDAVTSPAPGCLGRGNLSVVDPSRPQTTVAHELGHIMGRPHASAACGGGFPQPSEGWPPDEVGLLNGVGLDTRSGSGGSTGQYRLFYPGFANNGYSGTVYYDYMSYCTGQTSPGANCYEPCSWISPTGWTELFDYLHTHSQGFYALRPARYGVDSAHGSGGFAVTAATDGNGKGDILSVRPATGPQTASNPQAEFQLIVRDAAGGVLERIGLDGARVHVDRREPVVPLFFGATVPANAHQLQLADGDTVLGTRTRSAHAPTVALVAPRAGAHLPGKGRVLVRWRAHDADGDRLFAELDYSSDGGRTFHTVAAGLSGTRFALPVSLLAASKRARLRLVVSDGWNQTAVTSGVFAAKGSAPRVTITSPKRGFSLMAKALLYLSGGSTTDGGRSLAGKQLSWYAGKKLLGHGVSLGVTLPKGRVVIRLVGRDASGRKGSTTVTVTIR